MAIHGKYLIHLFIGFNVAFTLWHAVTTLSQKKNISSDYYKGTLQ